MRIGVAVGIDVVVVGVGIVDLSIHPEKIAKIPIHTKSIIKLPFLLFSMT